MRLFVFSFALLVLGSFWGGTLGPFSKKALETFLDKTTSILGSLLAISIALVGVMVHLFRVYSAYGIPKFFIRMYFYLITICVGTLMNLVIGSMEPASLMLLRIATAFSFLGFGTVVLAVIDLGLLFDAYRIASAYFFSAQRHLRHLRAAHSAEQNSCKNQRHRTAFYRDIDSITEIGRTAAEKRSMRLYQHTVNLLLRLSMEPDTYMSHDLRRQVLHRVRNTATESPSATLTQVITLNSMVSTLSDYISLADQADCEENTSRTFSRENVSLILEIMVNVIWGFISTSPEVLVHAVMVRWAQRMTHLLRQLQRSGSPSLMPVTIYYSLAGANLLYIGMRKTAEKLAKLSASVLVEHASEITQQAQDKIRISWLITKRDVDNFLHIAKILHS